MELILAVVIPMLAAGVCAWIRFKPQFSLRPIPTVGVLILLVGSVFGHEFFHVSAGPIAFTFDRILLVIAYALMGYCLFIDKEKIRSLNVLDISILVLMGVILLSVLTHDWHVLRNRPISRMLFFYMVPVALYWLARTSRLETGDLKFISVMLGLFGCYLALTGVAEIKDFSQAIFPGYIIDSEFREFLGRGRGPFLNPVSNGIFQTVCFCCVLMWWPHVQFQGKAIVAVIALLLAIGVYATLTRSVWVGWLAACGLFVWWPATRPMKGGMLIAATLVVIVFFPVLSKKLVSFKRDKEVSQAAMEQSAEMRPLFAIVAWNMFQDQPVLGVGFGHYSKEKYPYLQNPHAGKPLSITKDLMQHNVFLAYVTEMGLVGLAALMAVLIQMALVGWRVWNRRRTDLWARQFGLLSLVVLACYALNGLFHDVSIIPKMHVLLFFLVGLANNINTNQTGFEQAEHETNTDNITPTRRMAA